MLDFSHARFDYLPYPIALARPVMEPGLYQRMVAGFPPLDLFATYSKGYSHKYNLSENANADAYHDFIRAHRVWRPFYDYIKSERFVRETLECLERAGIRLGFERDVIASENRFEPRGQPRASRLSSVFRVLRGRPLPVVNQLSARFEFSSLPSDGGCIQPHTDQCEKVITLVLSMLDAASWNPAWGGGTEVLETIDPARSFNFLNAFLPLEECRTLKVFEYTPNQCVIFVKTFNSLHAVRPMCNTGGAELRRTLTINIERRAVARN